MSTPTTRPTRAEADPQCRINRLPRATYRLQLRSGFGFDQVGELLQYLDRLGISDLYLSPLFRAREESVHGYDVVDHSQVEPTFGDLEAFRRMAQQTQQAAMGIVLDIVPNHMGINDPGNVPWNDVLENGPGARSAAFFDIDWDPPGGERKRRVLLPFLGQPFGETLESGQLQVRYESGKMTLAYFERRFPLAPATWPPLLLAAVDLLPDDVDPAVRTELQSITTQLQRLPPVEQTNEAATQERYREQTVARQRLVALGQQADAVLQAIDSALEQFNGDVEDPASFDALERLLNGQHYRLAFWRVAVDEINYRRFFDVNDLAAIRVEDPDVFEVVHRLTFQLLQEGLVTGLRIDHPDGLLDPLEYFENLQTAYRQLVSSDSADVPSLFIVAEKILTGSEPLPQEWPISGTTGYEFLNQLSAVLVDPEGVQRLKELYPQLTGMDRHPRSVAYRGKSTILHDVMASELFVLASQLFRLARADRRTCDFTLPVLLRALREVIACFPVYRTYTRPQGWEVSNEDHGRIMEAVRWAKRRNPTMPWSAFDYIASVLLLEFPPYLSEDLQTGWRQLAVQFQQVTGPVTAKGIEDTSFYRYYPLTSLNEVGAELGSVGCDVDEFHRLMGHRGDDWPHSLSATATHDTKRGEDVRARLHVISEMPDAYATQFAKWDDAARSLTTDIDGQSVPDANARYFIHQSLVGTWPVGDWGGNTAAEDTATTWENYEPRMLAYFEKAFREAKRHTSWLNPAEPFERAVHDFVSRLLADRDALPFQLVDSLATEIAGAGYVNSLSQLVLKATLPGVPDFYQGCEFWDFRLVDPDNRRPVDYTARSDALADLQSQVQSNPLSCISRLNKRWGDSLKLFVTARVLDARRIGNQLFASGAYQPLEVRGEHASRVIAFARRYQDQWVIVVTPRLPQGLRSANRDAGLQSPTAFTGTHWGDTSIHLPETAPTRWRDHLSTLQVTATDGILRVADLYEHLFLAVLFENKD